MRTERGDIDAEAIVIAGGMFSAELGRLAGVRIPVVPMSHEYIVTQPFRERDPANPLPTLRDPDLLIYFREEGGGLVMGGYERPATPAFQPDDGLGFERIPADFNGRLLEDDWDRFEEIVENSRRRVPQMEDVKVTRMINGPEGFTPDNEFCLGETEVPGAVRGGRLLRPRPGGRGRRREGHGRVDRGRRAVHGPVADGRAPLRRAVPLALVHAEAGARDLRDLLRHPLPVRGAPGRAAAARLAGVRLAPRARRGVRREVRLGAGELVRAERGAGRRVAAAARVGGQALVAGDRSRAPRLPRGGRDLRRVVVREARGVGAGRRGPARAAVRQPGRARGRSRDLHADAELARRDRVRLHRYEIQRGALLDRDGDGVRQSRP